MTFFTSDQHFGHFNIIRLYSRPFGTVEEMDEALLSKWNAKVKADDTVYILDPSNAIMFPEAGA